jgi:iron complex outermembrane receptor protein
VLLLDSSVIGPETGGDSMERNLRRSVHGTLLTLLVVLGSTEALSQSTQVVQGTSATTATTDQGNSNASIQPESGFRLEEITVTATRREESKEKVPISVAALGQDEIANLGITNIADIAAMTPGLQFALPNGYASTITELSIRGMNTEIGANVVGIYLDDSPIQSRLTAYGNIGTPIPLTFDMQRVEVERGPQGTLFGAGSEAGTVRFIPNEPNLSTYSGFAQAGLAFTQGGDPSYSIGAAAGGPIVDGKLGFRASFWDQEDGGYIDRIDPLTGEITQKNANRTDKRSARIAFAFEPVEGIKITPAVYYQQIHQDDSSRFFGNYGSNPSDGIFINGTFVPEVSNDEFVLPTIKLQASLPFADLTFDSSYTHRELRLNSDASVFFGGYFGATGGFGSPLGVSIPTSPSDYSPLLVIGNIEAFTQEIRLASNQPDAFISWVAGMFLDHRRQREFQGSYTSAFGAPALDSYVVDGRMTDDQFAVFAQADFHLTHKLTATLGERVAHVTSKETDFNGTGLFNSGEPAVGTTENSETPNTPRVALSYQFDKDHMAYTAVAKGFRVGGGNAPIADFCGFPAPPYKSDYDWSYEVGTKDAFFDHRLQIDASAFHVVWYHVQQIIIPACGTAFATNTNDAVLNGFDLQTQALLTERLRATLAVGFVNAYFGSNYFIAPGVPLVLSGDKIGQLPQVNPPWNINLGADYEIPTAMAGKIRLHGEYQFNSHNPGPFVTQIPTSPNYYNLIVSDPATSLFNVRAAYEPNAFTVTTYINNIFNSHPKLGAFQFPVTSSVVTYSTFRPRTLGLEARYKF